MVAMSRSLPAFGNPFVILLALLHAYVGLRLLAPFGIAVQVAGVAVLAACFWLLPKGWGVREGQGPWAVLLAWVAMGFFSWLLVLTLARDLSLAVSFLALPESAHASWRWWSAAGVLATTPLITAVGFAMARVVARVVEIDVPVAGLPAALHGFTIAQISDIHVGPTIKRRFVERIVERVNGLEADMVAITGDLVDGPVHELAHHTEPLGGLVSRHGTYVVTGNHEYYSGAHAWIRELRRLDARVLVNEHVVLVHDGERLVIAGVTDWSAHHFDPSHRSDPHGAIAGAPGDIVRVLLAHQPRSALAAVEAGYHLQLSGHTHGGQMWPFTWLVRLQTRFVAGLYKLGRSQLYVSLGTGYWGPPIRVLAPAEITLLTLRSSS